VPPDEIDPERAHDDPELLALLKYVVVGGLLGSVCWHLGSDESNTLLRWLLKGAGGLLLLVAAWSAVWMVALTVLVVLAKVRGGAKPR
jgi:hypothetical protein